LNEDEEDDSEEDIADDDSDTTTTNNNSNSDDSDEVLNHDDEDDEGEEEYEFSEEDLQPLPPEWTPCQRARHTLSPNAATAICISLLPTHMKVLIWHGHSYLEPTNSTSAPSSPPNK
jgi:hypothetical protein